MLLEDEYFELLEMMKFIFCFEKFICFDVICVVIFYFVEKILQEIEDIVKLNEVIIVVDVMMCIDEIKCELMKKS